MEKPQEEIRGGCAQTAEIPQVETTPKWGQTEDLANLKEHYTMKSPYKLYRQLRLWNQGLGIVHKLVLIGSALGLFGMLRHLSG